MASLKKIGLLGMTLGLCTAAFAGGNDVASVATQVTTEFNAIAKLLSVTAYVAGVGFAMGGILQFKAHKENPQQVPLSKPVVMIVVAGCLLFLPTILNIAGSSLFGGSQTSAGTAGGASILGS